MKKLLGDLIHEAQSCFAFGQSVIDGVLQIRMNNVRPDGSWDFSKERFVPPDAVSNMKKYALREGDVLFNATNSPEQVGKSAYVANHGKDAVFSNHFLRLRTSGDLDPKYLVHYLGSQFRKGVFAAGCKQWVNQATFSAERLFSLEIPLPPLEEQRHIAAILDKGRALQVLISRREKAFQAIEESLYAALSEQGRTARFSRAFDFADVFWLQEGPGVRNWQFTAEGVKLLNVGNITPDGKVNLEKTNRHISEEEAFGRYSHFLVDEGDLLMPSSGIPIDEDGLLRTRSAFASAEHLPLYMNTSTIRFKPKMAGASLLFLQGWLQSREFRAQITKLVTGSAQKNFGPSHLKQLQITLPEPSAQSEFEEKLNKIRGLRASLSPSVAEADRLIGSVSHRLFAGREHE